MIEWEASYKELNEAQLNGDILKIAGAELHEARRRGYMKITFSS